MRVGDAIAYVDVVGSRDPMLRVYTLAGAPPDAARSARSLYIVAGVSKRYALSRCAFGGGLSGELTREVEHLAAALRDATTPAQRDDACVFVAQATSHPELRDFLWPRIHLAMRGGWEALAQEAQFEPEDSPLRAVFGAPINTLKPLWRTRVRDPSARYVEVLENDDGNARPSAFDAVGATHDGAYVVACTSYPTRLGMWETRTGTLVWQREKGQPRDGRNAVAVSPNSELIALGYHRDVLVVHRDNAIDDMILRGTEGPQTLAFVDDDHLLTLDANILSLWQVRSRKRIAAEPTVGTAFALSPDCSYVVIAGTNGPSELRALPSLAKREAKLGTPTHAWSVAHHPTRPMIAYGLRDNSVWLVDLTDGESTKLGAHSGWVFTCGFSPDGALLHSGGWDGAVQTYDVEARAFVGRTYLHDGMITGVLALAGALVSCAQDSWGGGSMRIGAPQLRMEELRPIGYGDAPLFGMRVRDQGIACEVGSAHTSRVTTYDWNGALLQNQAGRLASAKTEDVIDFEGLKSRALRSANGDQWYFDANIASLARWKDRLVVLDTEGHVTVFLVA